jgi:hypothetical protein
MMLVVVIWLKPTTQFLGAVAWSCIVLLGSCDIVIFINFDVWCLHVMCDLSSNAGFLHTIASGSWVRALSCNCVADVATGCYVPGSYAFCMVGVYDGLQSPIAFSALYWNEVSYHA